MGGQSTGAHRSGYKAIVPGASGLRDGLPTEDPYEGYEGGGSLAPMGQHKGYGLALAHEMPTAVLTGGKWTRNIKSLYEEVKRTSSQVDEARQKANVYRQLIRQKYNLRS